MWGLCVSLLFFELQIVQETVGVQITPCTDSFVEVPAKKSLTLNCTPLTQTMEWRLFMGGTSYLLAKLNNSRYETSNTYYNVFLASSDDKGIFLTINTSNNRNIPLVNVTVECIDLTKSPPSSSNCGLNYVYKPNASDFSCKAAKGPNGDELSCTINNIYSSLGIYTCQALRKKDKEPSDVEKLETVNITALNDKSGLKVSGECNITTKLPENPGNYSYRVKILPGGREVLANLPGGGIWIEHVGTSTNVSSQAAIYGVPGVWLVAALVLL